MREIRFRGFHTCDGDTTICVGGKEVRGRWVYGSLVIENRTHDDPMYETTEYFIHDCYYHNGDFRGGTYHVVAESVGQFTGLTDDNGKQIYDGDKVAFSEFDYNGTDKPMDGTVYWGGTAFWIDGTEKYGDEAVWSLQYAHYQDPCMTVTGTVFDAKKEG